MNITGPDFKKKKHSYVDGNMDRRTFLGLAAGATGALVLPSAGCTGFRQEKPPTIDYSKNDLFLTRCNIIDVKKGKIMKEKTLIIKNGIISKITNIKNVPANNVNVIDLQNRYLIPGLIDSHCHTTLGGTGKIGLLDLHQLFRQLKRNYMQHIMSGTTTVRDMGAFGNLLPFFNNQISDGDIPGPRVVHVGKMVNLKGGHPDIDPSNMVMGGSIGFKILGELFPAFKNTDELRATVLDDIMNDSSFIKLTMDNKSLLAGAGRIPVYSEQHMRKFLSMSEKYNKPIAVHVHYKFGFDRALQYPVFSIEHSIGDSVISDKDVTIMAKNNIASVPTLSLASLLAAEEAYDEIPREFMNDFVENEQKLRREFFYFLPERYSLPGIHQKNMEQLNLYKAYNKTGKNLYSNNHFLPEPSIYYGMLTKGVENLKRMKDAGVLIGCGTDAGVTFSYHGTLSREIELFTRIGFTNAEALKCATINNARILLMEDKIGSIEVGKYADLVVLEKNPLDEIEACRTPHLVIKDGQVCYSEADHFRTT